MIRTFIALELKDEETIEEIQTYISRLKKNQSRLSTVKPENLHLTVKFLGDIHELTAPKIFKTLEEEVNKKFFNEKSLKYTLKGVGQFNQYSVIWIDMKGDLKILQDIKDIVEKTLNTELKIPKDKRSKFTPHLTIGRLRKNKINYKTFNNFKKIIQESKTLEFGSFNISGIKLKQSDLTPKGPIYTDLVF